MRTVPLSLFPGSPTALTLLCCLLSLNGCAPKIQDQVVATVGSDAITLADYERMYSKSSGTRDTAVATSVAEREKFLDLMVNYRLKLADASRQGIGGTPEVLSEIQQYKGSLAASFLTEREVVTPGLKRLHARRQEEIRASHILLELGPKATPAESTAAYQKAYEVIAQAKAGTDFGVLASQLSKDPSATRNKGDLYYFTGGQMVRPFEDAVFALKVGEISPTPIRTQYGLHVVKVIDRKPTRGEIHCSHIMIRFPSASPTPDDTITAYAKIKAIQDSVAGGIDFARLARSNSDDPGSAVQGGDLGWFQRRRWVQPFDEMAFTLRPGEVSPIIRTNFGYHLIKCLDQRPPKPFEEARQDLQQIYQQMYFQEEYRQLIDRLQQTYAFRLDTSVVRQVVTSVDSSRVPRDSLWDARVPTGLRSASMFSLQNKPVSVDSVIRMLKVRQDINNSQLRTATLLNNLDKLYEQHMFALEADRLQRMDPEFAALLKEYTEGILLYQIEQENVWSKVQPTDSLLREYHAANRSRFTYPDRVRFTEIRSTTQDGALALRAKLLRGVSPDQVLHEDSARMAMPTSFRVPFARGSVRISKSADLLLSSVATELKADTLLRLTLLSRPDTVRQKSEHLRLASRRLETLTARLTKKFHLRPDRITSVTRPTASGEGGNQDTIFLEIVGKRALVSGKVESFLLAPPADERARRADSLSIGAYSIPFFHKASYTIVRLDGREPAREKSFEEASPEVSTAFQDYEAKRLEAAWLQRLRAQYPVTKNPTVLKDAFAPQR